MHVNVAGLIKELEGQKFEDDPHPAITHGFLVALRGLQESGPEEALKQIDNNICVAIAMMKILFKDDKLVEMLLMKLVASRLRTWGEIARGIAK